MYKQSLPILLDIQTGENPVCSSMHLEPKSILHINTVGFVWVGVLFFWERVNTVLIVADFFMNEATMFRTSLGAVSTSDN